MMNTKIAIVATVAALSLATTAFAGEGNGDPFPFRAPASALSVTVPLQDTGSQGYQAYAPNQVGVAFDNATLPEDGQNGPVQTANSLPVGFETGTVTYMEARSVNTWLAQQADHRFAQNRTVARPRG